MKIRKWEYHPKLWGCELWLENNSLYCGKILVIRQQYICSYHKHIKKSETFAVLDGQVILVTGNVSNLITTGDCVTIPKGTFHQFIGASDAMIVEVSTPHSDNDVVRSQLSKRLSDRAFAGYLRAVGIRKPSASGHTSSSTSHARRVPTKRAVSRIARRISGSQPASSGNAASKAGPGRHGGSSKPRKGARGSASSSPSGSTRKPRRSSRDTSVRS